MTLSIKSSVLSSWGNTYHSPCKVFRPESFDELSRLVRNNYPHGLSAFAYGLNYGDEAFNTGGHVVQTNRLDHILAFDENSGELVCEPGVTFRDLLSVFLPRGWMPPVIPGTLGASIGGAVANDVHGKNHHRYGSFGHHVQSVELVTPRGIYRVSPSEKADLFAATVGGLGLTGLMSKISMRLVKAVPSVEVEAKRVVLLEQWMELLTSVPPSIDFCAGWMDCLPMKNHIGRGILYTARFAPDVPIRFRSRQYPILPFSLVNPFMLRLFNEAYFHHVPENGKKYCQHLMDFINPLDKLKNWNQLYGSRGFYQLQCVFPYETSLPGLKSLLSLIERYHVYPGLAVIKSFHRESIGLLSFPMPGITLALDLKNNSESKKVFHEMMAIVREHQGRIYLAKDALLEQAAFQDFYPNYQVFNQVREKYGMKEYFQSDLSRRVGLNICSG